MEEKRLFLLDAYALIFRAYYALIKMPRMTQEGFNTSAVFGFVNTLEDVLRREHPSHIAVCFDPPGPTFRSKAFADYKGERAATPEDIKLSVPIIKEILKAYRIPIVEKEGYEADDVIGTLAMRAREEGFTVYMMTPDKDFGQLVRPDVLQYKPSYRGQDFELRGPEEVKARYGLQDTRQVIDLLALMGDKIDNIPGCPGVGEKTAVKLISEFGSVEQLLATTDRLKGALKKKVEENAEQIVFSKDLATIRTDVPLDIDPEEMRAQTPDRDKLFAIFRSLEFKTLADRVSRRLDGETGTRNKGQGTNKGGEERGTRGEKAIIGSLFDFGDDGNALNPEPAPEPISVDSSCRILTADLMDEFSKESLEANRCGIVMYAPGDNDMALDWQATAVAFSPDSAWWIPTSFAQGQAALLDLLARPDIEKVTANSKTDMLLAWRWEGTKSDSAVARPNEVRDNFSFLISNFSFFDVSLAHYLLQPDGRHSIDAIASHILNVDLIPTPATPSQLKAEPADARMKRLAQQACVLLQLREPLELAVKKADQWALLTDIEMPLAPVLAKMEAVGVRIDENALRDAARVMEAKISDIEKEIFDIAGMEFNVGSPSKVGEVLFDHMGLDPKAKKTKTGQYSTSETVLEKVAHKSPIVGKILEWRQLRKLVNTYLNALPECVNPATGRVHTNYNQTVTATGRISSSNPNLQNIPVREDVGREIRRAFIPSEGNLFLSADYSQIELRLVADFADDQTMLDAFNRGDDIHAITAAKIYHKSPEEVSADERRHAKTANFGILYGITAFGLASRLGIPRGEAKELIDNYFATFPTIRRYMSDSIESAREKGYAETRMGRRRPLPDIRSANPVVRGYAERNAVNAPVQGSAADIIKRAMIDIDREMTQRNLRSAMIMQVHDELNFDVVPEELPVLQEIVERCMEGAFSGKVRLTASSGVASNWLDAH